MNLQTLVVDPNRVTPVQIDHAIEKFAIRVHRRGAAYVFGRTDECQSLAPSYPSQLARRTGTVTMNTSLSVGGGNGEAQCDVGSNRSNGMNHHIDDLFELTRDRSPAHESASIDCVGAYATFLTSDAARLVTGSIAYVDAGYDIMGV